LNQGNFLRECIESVLAQGPRVEVFVADGGSVDASLEVLGGFADRLAGWTSGPDGGQAMAINDAIGRGGAPLVCWLNADDMMLPGALAILSDALDQNPDAPFAFGRVMNEASGGKLSRELPTGPFDLNRFARKCMISQPGTLIRRDAWNRLGGLNEAYAMALDYDLWWRLSALGKPVFVDAVVAKNRDHLATKTRRYPIRHSLESMRIVHRATGSIPFRWWLGLGYAGLRQIQAWLHTPTKSK